METRTQDAGLTGRPTLASSWGAASGALAQSLLLTRAGVGAPDLDWEELLAPPAPGQDLVRLSGTPDPRGGAPCFLDLSCDPERGEEVLALAILSSARNMEVYAGEEYCGTGRGKRACSVPDGSEHEKIILYKKYLKLESSTRACKIKLLSFGEKQCVFISKVVVYVRPALANSSPSSPALGSRIDLDKVQTIMDSMGSKLSPGAQQLMNMVRFQQQNRIPLGEQLQSVLGTAGYKHMTALQPSSTSGPPDKSSSTPFPFRTGLTSANGTENVQTFMDESTRPPGEGSTTNRDGCKTAPQNHSLLENDLKNAVSSFSPKKASGSSLPSSELLPFLQNLCSQVNHLRVGHNAKWQENLSKPREGIVGVAMEEQPICSYLEKILSKNMELMEKKLVDYIDQRMHQLQEHIDDKVALLMDFLQNPNSPPTGLPLRHCDSGERLSNGER
ncbi:ATPase PAAT isoform X1 [Sciurus carolinensis]|uniref:ATPase PAAT isoform X1 n=1 Tax=Sciurus carolinensis TaxID=30640 RepID=UPI001FB282AA|nr:ATPase PAAT isoform X1 [Sciurus carolinensis]